MKNISDINIPRSPGVYHFLDENGLVLYVGKAKNLKNRIRQYFLKELNRGVAIEQMVRLAADIKWIETESEIEAVLLEAELIKKLKPKYNIRQKDDKSFLTIRIAKKISNAKLQISNKSSNSKNKNDQMFPIVEMVRFKDVDLKDKTADYFGPYPAGLLLKKSIRYLRKIFPFRDCSKTKFNTYKKRGRPCIYGDIGVCTGPCLPEITKEQYYKNINYLKQFLRGRKKRIIADLEKEMKSLSRQKNYEQAAIVRNQLKGLLHLKDVALGIRDDAFDPNDILFKRIECYDIANIGEQFAVGSMVVFTNGKPDKNGYRRFRVKSEKLKVESDLERLEQVLQRRFKNDWPKPDLVIVDGGELQLRVAVNILSQSKLNIPAISISKGPKRQKNDFHFSNADIAKYFSRDKYLQRVSIAARDEAHRFAISYYRLLHKKSLIEN